MKKLCLFCLFVSLFVSGCFCNRTDDEVITFSTWGSASEMKILEPIVKEFEYQNPGVKVKILHIPQDYFKKLHLLFASNMEPDVVLINNQNIPVYSKFLYPLDDFIERNQFFEKSIQSLSQNSVIYAVPRDCSGLVVYYNKDIFDDSGVSYPKSDWDIEEMIDKAKRITNKIHWGISYEPLVYYAQPFMHYYGGGVFSGENSNSRKGIETYKNLAYFFHVAPTPSEIGSKTLAQLFLEGKLGMHISGRWMIPKYRECATFRWDVINFPHYAASCDVTGWAISKRSKHKDSAKKFIMFISDCSSIASFTKSGLIVPARKDVANSMVFKSGLPMRSDVFIKSVENSDITRVDLRYNREVERLNDIYFNLGK